MKRRIFFALCTSSPSSFLPKLPTKWRVETSLSSRPCLLPSLRLRNLFTSSFLLAPFTATAGKPRNKSRHRFFPLRTTRSTDKTSRITIFSTGIERRCTLAKVSLRFKHFFTLYPFAEIFFYISKLADIPVKYPISAIVKDIASSIDRGTNRCGNRFLFLSSPPRIFPPRFFHLRSEDGLFRFAATNFERVSPVDRAVGLNQLNVVRR